jgi:hypothetical protein
LINKQKAFPYLRNDAPKIGRTESQRKEIVEVPFLDANSDSVDVKGLHAQPVKVGGKRTWSSIQRNSNTKDTFAQRNTEKEAVELATEKDVVRVYDCTESWIYTRERDNTLGGHVMGEFVHAVIGEVVQGTIRRRVQE